MNARAFGIALAVLSCAAVVRSQEPVNAWPPPPDPTLAPPPTYTDPYATPSTEPVYPQPDTYAPPADPGPLPPAPSDPSSNAVNAPRNVSPPVRAPLVPWVDRAMTSGLGVGTGLGSDNVWLGAHLIYYLQLPSPRVRFALHAGMGLLPWRDPDIRWGTRGGGFFSYGVRNRFVIGATGGTMDWQTFGLHGRALASRQEYGLGFEIGYEFMSPFGFYARASIGPGVAFSRETPLRERDAHLVWRGNLLSIGYKLW